MKKLRELVTDADLERIALRREQERSVGFTISAGHGFEINTSTTNLQKDAEAQANAANRRALRHQLQQVNKLMKLDQAKVVPTHRKRLTSPTTGAQNADLMSLAANFNLTVVNDAAKLGRSDRLFRTVLSQLSDIKK